MARERERIEGAGGRDVACRTGRLGAEQIDKPLEAAMPDAIACRVRRSGAEQIDTRPDVLVARLAAARLGVLSLAELRACGLSSDAVSVRVRNGHLHRVHRAVYAVGHANLTLEGRFLAAVKACGEPATLSHASAGALWGLMSWDDRHPQVTVGGTATRRVPGVRVHRSLRLTAKDVTVHRSVPVTTPARTLVDLSAMLTDSALRRAVREARSRRLLTLDDLGEALHRLGPRRGSGKLTRLIATGPAPTRSELEDQVLDLILRGGLEHPDVNVPLVLDGRRVIPDFRWSARRLVLEADGAAWHDGHLARDDDAVRQALLERHGERVLRVTWHQVVERPDETLERMLAAGAPRAS
jgi:hypothetical protein